MKEITVNLSNGAFYKVERQSIKTSFCYGFGFCGVSNAEEESIANNNAQIMKESESLFIKENLYKIDARIKIVKENLNKNFYGFYNYRNSKEISLIDEMDFYRYTQEIRISKDNFILLTEEDKRLILEGLELEKASFIKRLNTYLKRYGLSKVRTWSYLVD